MENKIKFKKLDSKTSLTVKIEIAKEFKIRMALSKFFFLIGCKILGCCCDYTIDIK